MRREKKENVEVKPKNYPREHDLSPDIWKIFILVTIFVSFFLVSFSYVFLKKVDKKIFYLILTLDMIYILDYVVGLLNFFWRKVRIRLNKQPIRTKSVLITDFFVSFPYSYTYKLFCHTYNHITFLCIRSILLLHLSHFVLFFKEKWKTAGNNHIKYFTIQYIICFLVFTQCFACLWYLLAFPDDPSYGWSKVNDLRDKYKHASEQYIICIYFALINITNRNYGDLVPLGIGEKILIIAMLCIGFILTTGIFIATLSFLLDIKYKRRTTLKMQLQNVLMYLKSISTSIGNREIIERYYKTLWIKKNGVHQATQFELLPYPLRSIICVDVNIGFLQTSTLFLDKPDAFLRMVSNLMKHEFCQAREIIYHRNVVKDKMVFVAVGTIEILSAEDDESPIIALNPGTCIGESALILTFPAKCSVRTATYTELQVLYQKDFYKIIDTFPQVYNHIRETIMQRITDSRSVEFISLEKIELIPFFPPPREDNAVKNLKDELRQTVRKPEKLNLHLSLYQLKDNTEDTGEGPICFSKKFPWIIRPNSSLSRFWEGFIIIIALYISLTYPLYIVFLKRYPTWFNFFTEFIDLFLVMDIFVILITAIERKNTTIKTSMEILQHRLKESGFYLDFISCIKTELFYWIWTKNPRVRDVLKLNRLLKVYRIPKLIHKMEDKIELHMHFVRLLKYIFYLLISIYWFGAFLYLTTCFDNLCTEDGWFFTKLLKDLKEQLTSSYTSHEILTSVYYALSPLTGLTTGDIRPNNITDMVTSSVGAVLGVFMFNCCVAQLSATITRRLKPYTDFQEILFSVVKFIKAKQLEKDLVKQVKNYFVLQWCYNKALVLQEQPLLFNVHKNLQTKVQIDEKIETINSVPIFDGQDLNFLLQIVAKAKILILPPDQFVTYKGEMIKMLYIIEKGYCIRQFEKSFVILGPKSYFGMICLFTNMNCLCNVKTLTHVKILCITEEMFWESASMYPTVEKQFTETSEIFDVLNEFKKIPIQPKLAAILGLEEDSMSFEGSFVNVISYCRQHGESYSASFRQLDILCWIQILMLPICILPYGSFLKIWMAMRLVVALVIAILTPYHLVQIPYAPTLDKILFVADLITYVDLYVMMFVGYYGSNNQLIVHPLKTAVHYLKGKFILDLVLCFPWEIFITYFVEDTKEKPSPQSLSNNFQHIVRIIRVGQIYRLPQYFNHVTQIKKRINSNILQILKYFPITLIFINFWAAIVIANSCKYYSGDDLSEDIYNDSFVKPDGLAHHSPQPFAMFCNQDSWIDKSKSRHFTEPHEVYILAMYFCTGVLTACGLGDVTPTHTSTLVITIIMNMCGVLFVGYVYALISSHKAYWYSLLFKYQEAITELKKFMMQENVTEKLQQHIIDRLEYGWKRNRGVEPNQILAKLHPALFEDTVFAMYEDTLKKVSIFENVERPFFRVLGKIVKERYYLRQEIIYKADDIVSEICIVDRGTVKIVSKQNDMEVFMEAGGVFGNLIPSPQHKISVTITALSNVDILFMETEDFYNAIEQYPVAKETIRDRFGTADFIMPTFVDTSEEIPSDTKLYSETTASSLTRFGELKTTFIGFFLICLPWKLFQIAIPPQSLVYSFFEIHCLLLTYISTVLVTYEFAFQHHSFYLLGFAVYVDIMFIFKILLEMHKAYENPYGELVISNKRILLRYFHKRELRRIIDFLVNFPFYYLAFLAADPYLLFSSLRMVTLFRIVNFFDYYNEKSNQLMTNRFLLKISHMMIWCTLVIHIFACGWYLCACPVTSCFNNSWLNKHFDKNGANSNKIRNYVSCIYFVVTLITTTGTGDIVANNIQEQIYVIVLMITAIFLIGIFIGEIWNFLNSTTGARINYEYGINELKHYLQNSNVSDFQMKKMWRYVQQLWPVSNGNQIPLAVSLLHSVTFHELMTEIYGHHVRKSYVFSDVDEPFTRQLCQYLKRVIFFPGNFIVQHGDFDNSMYFIHHGEVDILTVHPNLTETIHEVLRTGDMFGVTQGLFPNVPHHFSYRARTRVHIVVLHFSDWEHLLNFFPENKDTILMKTTNVNV